MSALQSGDRLQGELHGARQNPLPEYILKIMRVSKLIDVCTVFEQDESQLHGAQVSGFPYCDAITKKYFLRVVALWGNLH
jgi:hypothetical protein